MRPSTLAIPNRRPENEPESQTLNCAGSERYLDDDNELALEILSDAHLRFQQRKQGCAGRMSMTAAAKSRPVRGHDTFAAVRDLVDDDDA